MAYIQPYCVDCAWEVKGADPHVHIIGSTCPTCQGVVHQRWVREPTDPLPTPIEIPDELTGFTPFEIEADIEHDRKKDGYYDD